MRKFHGEIELVLEGGKTCLVEQTEVVTDFHRRDAGHCPQSSRRLAVLADEARPLAIDGDRSTCKGVTLDDYSFP